MVKPLNIAGRLVGPGQPCLVIAEAGVNHNGRLDLALALVDAAAAAGAEAVKFQTFRAEEVASPLAPKAAYQAETTGQGQSQLAMLKALELAPADYGAIRDRCRARGLIFLSTPFDAASATLLAELDMPAFKVPSGELTNLPLLAHIGAQGRPVILSTGMATLGEVGEAVDALRAAGCAELALLHCLSNYPADPAQVNLRAMTAMGEAFGLPVGYSDHTLGLEAPLAAVALGACIIEKHFTLDRDLQGPDHRASATVDELTALVAGVRKVEAALGHGRKEPAPDEAGTRAVARRSLVAAKDIPAGALITADMLALKRPGTGLAPAWLAQVVGRRAAMAIPAGALLSLEMLA
ncbi:MAG: N-acetylneuraminate synthase [Pseudomonadota bacterium]